MSLHLLEKELFLKIKALYRYPVKSFKKQNLDSVLVQQAGFIGDRNFMLVDEKGVFITQRKWSKMCLIQAWINDEKSQILNLKIPGKKLIKISIDYDCKAIPHTKKKVIVWNDSISARLVTGEFNKELSEFIGLDCCLVEMNPLDQRKISHPEAKGVVSFADAFPFLIIGTASLAQLNQKLGKSVSMDHFRPNIVVETEIPHEEDLWDEIQIGDVVFKNSVLCSRCVMTTINPETAERNKKLEPLKTLSTYRTAVDGKIMFGTNMLAVNEGEIEKTQKIEVISYREQIFANKMVSS